MSRKWVLVTVAVVVAALAVGVVASHALTGGDSHRALPPVGPTQPLIGPNDGTFGSGAASSSPAPPTPANGVPKPNVVGTVQRYSGIGGGSIGGGSDGGGSGGGGSGGGGSSSPSTPATTPATTASGSTPSSTPATTPSGTPAATATTIGATVGDPTAPRPLVGLGLVHFTDPCAAGGAGCRAGFGGTILPIDDRFPAFRIISAESSYCDGVTTDDVDSPMIAVHSSAPGHFWAHVHGDNDTSLNGNGFRASYEAVSTPDDEVARWNASGRTTDVVTCFTIPTGLRSDPSHHYTAHIEGVSEPDGLQHDAYDLGFTYQRGGRPPVVVTPGGFATDRLVSVDIPGGPTAVPHIELRTAGSSEYAPNCPDAVLVAMPALSGGTDLPTSELRSPGYPYSRVFSQHFTPSFTTAKDISTGAQVPFDVNTKYALCIRWVNPSNPGDSTLPGTLSLRLESPDRYQMQLRVKSVDFPSARPFTIDVNTFGGNCKVHLTGNAAHLQYIDAGFDNTNFAYDTGGDPAASATAYPNGPTSCDQADPMTFADSGFAIGNPDGSLSTEVDITLAGTTYESSIWVPISACSPSGSPCPFQQSFHEAYTMPIGSAANGSVTLDVLFLHSSLYHGDTPWPVDDPHPNPHYAWTGGGSY